ncbi:MAG: glycoside hydrolase family 32 protein [Chloroflexi bacterium]|nr:glycoside hydrolase family 32 protein [Chloroflexota bacterium]
MLPKEPALTTRQRLAGDRHRPRYHFQPPSNWMNDPNGLIQWNGQYHLFYQHNPNGPLWADMHWGHAVSDDLLHWTDLPVALAPTPGGPDEAGVFSGCAVNNNGVPTLIYTGTRGEHNEIQTQCIASSDDALLTWRKYPGNPVLDRMPDEAGQTRDFRDPFVWQDGDTWYMALGSRIQDVGGAVFLYRSPDLIHWEYLNPLLVGDIHRHGVTWECPNFFKLGDQWVLIISSHMGNYTASVLYFAGSYENHRFTPRCEGVLDYGTLYAPLTLLDDRERRILFGWLREDRPAEAQKAAGWSGVQSIPRVLSLDAHNRLNTAPIPELATLRGRHYHYGPQDGAALAVSGLALDIVAAFETTAAGLCGISVACSGDGRKRTDIVYDVATQRLAVRKITPELFDITTTQARDVPHPLAAGEPLQLRILLDGSVVEIIANGRTSLTSRIYPLPTDGDHVQVIGAPALQSLDIWEMSSIWHL